MHSLRLGRAVRDCRSHAFVVVADLLDLAVNHLEHLYPDRFIAGASLSTGTSPTTRSNPAGCSPTPWKRANQHSLCERAGTAVSGDSVTLELTCAVALRGLRRH